MRVDVDWLMDECKERKKLTVDTDGKQMGCVQTCCMCMLMQMDAGGGGGGEMTLRPTTLKP